MKLLLRSLTVAAAVLGLCMFAPKLSAATLPSSITYVSGHYLFHIPLPAHPEWRRLKREWYFEGQEAVPPAALLTCGPDEPLPVSWEMKEVREWDPLAIERTIERDIASKLDRPAGVVTVSRSGSDAPVVFTGTGLIGRRVDLAKAAVLTLKALMDGVDTVVLPVDVEQPKVTVTAPELAAMGIKEVVMIGESSFAGSPVNRRHNIGVGIRRFNGVIVPQGSVFSFVSILGPVNEKTGYRKELVIQGDETIPDYGGGLCQISSTAYRGPWEYGLPIVQRRNHSYAVSYYSPQGTDATIYPPSTDFKFHNDTPGALLLQALVDDRDRAFFIYYGTHDDRRSEIFGPFIWDRVAAPKEERIEYSIEVPLGEKKKVGDRHDGMKVLWYRTVQMAGTGAVTERVFSQYQARPLSYQIGVASGESRAATNGTFSSLPSWLPKTD